MHLTVVSGSVSAIQTGWGHGITRSTSWFRIDNHPASMKHQSSLMAPQPVPFADRDHITACGLREPDFLLVLALYNHTTGEMARLPVGRQTAGCILIGLLGVFLVIQDSHAVQVFGLLFLAAAGFTARHVRRITKASHLIRQHIQPPRQGSR